MRVLPKYLIVAVIMVAMLAASCDVDVNSDDGDAPTAFVITSTPTPEQAQPATTEPEEPAPSATPLAEPTSTVDSGEPTESPDEPTGTPEPETGSNSEARAEIEEIEADVVDLRGLELLHDLDEQIIDRQELARRVEDIIAEEYSPEEARVDALTYWLLRLIPDRSLDLYQLQIDLLSEQIAGYYDPETDELVVVTNDGTLTVTDKITMAHEIVHALQDQHYDLVAIDEFAVDSDHEAAITALVEGDATLAMTDYMFGYLDPMDLAALLGESLTAADTEVLDNAPRYIADGLLFSYEAGQTFATALFDMDGYATIDQAFDDPPTSTEQILHPEKYLSDDKDEPVEVNNPDILQDLGSGWELLRSDTLGEWDFRIMLEENGVSASQATMAAAGWGGSRFDIYESDSGALALLTTRWDSDDDASEFADALVASFENGNANGEIWEESDRIYSVVANGDTVVVISGTDRDAVEAALAIIDQSI